jgi:stress-induced-phosphoprotein 1
VAFSNRSGAYAAMKQFDQALEDAQKCIQLNPQFVKGYSRQGLALFNLGRLSQAKEAYQQGLTIDGNNEQLKEGLRECEESLACMFSLLFYVRSRSSSLIRCHSVHFSRQCWPQEHVWRRRCVGQAGC